MVVTYEKLSAKLEKNRAKRYAKYEAATNEGWKFVRKLEETYFIPQTRQQRNFESGLNSSHSHYYRVCCILLLQKGGN